MAVVLKHKRATLERIEKYISDTYFTDVNLYGRVDTVVDEGLQIFRSIAKDQTYGAFEAMKKGEFAAITVGETFKPLWSQHWIKVVISAAQLRSNNLYLHWDVDGAESLVCEESGELIQGMSCKRKEMKVSSNSPDVDVVYYIQVSCTGLFGAGNNGMINPPDESKTYSLNKAHLFSRSQNKYEVFMDLSVLYDIAKEMSDDTSLCYDALYAANDIINQITLNNHSPASYIQAIAMGRQFFAHDKASTSRDRIHAIANCHIDSAWLWPYRESIRKVARSWSTTLSLFDSGNNFHFAGSQVVQFDWLKKHYPSLFEKLRAAVKKGSFIPVGGTWVEMDTNIPSGESMIRQFLYGQKFYRKEFGVHSDILWLPDTFGYSGQLPQIMKICDIKYFLSQKLSWNLTNTFPHHTFYWKGIDQSRVLAHFPPGDTYESHVQVKDVIKSVKNNKDKGRTHDQMLLFGYGDGGGGPTPDMISRLERLRCVSGLPTVTPSTPAKFFEAIEKSKGRLCEWWGELYFELHRGTYTTHAKLKEMNRRCEFLMMDLEFLSALDNSAKVCPEKIEEMWKIVLFNQFHDILPGSSIQKVFEDAMEDYASFLELWNTEYDKLRSKAGTSADGFVVNPFNWERTQVVTIGGTAQLVKVPALSAGPVQIAATQDKAGVFELKDGVCLCNSQIKAVFSHSGALRSLIHKASKRECLAPGGGGNHYVIFDDIPLFWDAWDVMEYHTETRQEYPPTSLEVTEEGPLRVGVKIHVPLAEHGSMVVFVTLDAESPYLQFRCEVDWKASHKFLKVEMPLSVSATEAEYEIQCGYVKRPTHPNTSWDSAKFEVSGHKWAHLGEPNFGVGLLSKSKYGYSAQHNRLTMSLLRSPKAPDGNADMGSHTMEYAVYPHTGPLYSSRIVEHAHNFAHPLVARDHGATGHGIVVAGEGVVVQALKKSEDGLGTVVRLYEAYGNTCEAVISGIPFKQAFSINAVERDSSKTLLTAGDTSNSKVIGPIKFKPFEIRTVYIEANPAPGQARKVSAASSSDLAPAKKQKM